MPARYHRNAIFQAVTLFLLSLLLHSCAILSKEVHKTNDWTSSAPESQGMESRVLADMMVQVRDRSYHIDSILVVRNGRKVLDAYFWPFEKGEKHNIYSCTKSVMSALVGIAIDRGHIRDVHQPVAELLPGYGFAHEDPLKQRMTLEHLLMMASGLECRDSYRYLWKGLFEMKSTSDWAQYVLELPMESTPGQKFEYCNGVSHLLSVIIQNRTGKGTLEFAQKHLFGPLGIQDIAWDKSPGGYDVGYGTMRLLPDDMAKFGWLYLNGGKWGKSQIVPNQWVAASTKGRIRTPLFDGYGYQWWVDSSGYYMAVGFKGQRIFVVPDKNLVAVFTGDLTGPDSLVSKRLLDTYILPAASGSKSLSPDREGQRRLAALVDDLAREPTAGLVWITEAEGVAKDGVFRRTATPAFQFEYPYGSKKSGINYPGQVMRMKTLTDVNFFALVSDIPKGIPLKAFGPEAYVHELKRFGRNVKVIANRETTLKCGTRAYRTDISWETKSGLPITTLLTTAYKEGKVVFVCAHPWKNTYSVEPIVESLRFN